MLLNVELSSLYWDLQEWWIPTSGPIGKKEQNAVIEYG